MTKLQIENGDLTIIGESGSEIFDWEHQLFLTTVMGYSLNERNLRYVFKDQTELLSALNETTEYLVENNIEFMCDSAIAEMLRRFEQEKQAFTYANEIGLEIQKERDDSKEPPNFIRSLLPHQDIAVNHLVNVRNGANFSVPGSGKTSVIFGAFDILREKDEIDKLLIIGPRSCFLPWEDEYHACFGKIPKSARLSGPKTSRQSVYLNAKEYDFFLTTYQTAVNDLKELIYLCKQFKTFVVLDESHNIKRIEGGIWAEAMLDLAPYAERRAILSGTPLPNSIEDLWTQITFLWPGQYALGDRHTFRSRCENGSELTSIRDEIRPIFVRVNKSDLNLPPVNIQRLEYPLNYYQEKIYRALATKFIVEATQVPEDRRILREWRKAKIVRLIQTASNPTLLAKYSEEFDIPPSSGEGSSITQLIDRYPQFEIPSKVEATLKLTKELIGEGNKVVIWTSFIHNISMLQALFEDIKTFVLFGAVPKDETEDIEFNREQQIEEFKEVSSPAILLANPAACAESISLHKACQHAIYLDRTFNCGQYMQSKDRIHRVGLGTDEIVYYYILMASNTIDETIDRRLNEKQARMLALLDGDLEIGTFDVDPYQIGLSKEEEEIDFKETLKDLHHSFGDIDQ